MNIKAIVIASALTALLAYIILTPPSFFNFLPFAIHESLFRNTSIQEHQFILAFDVTCLVIFYFSISNFLKRRMK